MGSLHACAIRTDGSVECWGPLGGLPALAAGSDSYKTLSVGTYHSCGIRADDTIRCWSAVNHGQADPPSTG